MNDKPVAEIYRLMAELVVNTRPDGKANSSFGVVTDPPELGFAELAYLLQMAKQGVERALVATASQAAKAGPDYAVEFRKGVDAAMTTKGAGDERWGRQMGTDPVWVGGTTITTPHGKRGR